MFTTATKAPAREPVAITDRRHLGVAAMSAIAIVVGLAVWFLATTMGYAGENTGAMVALRCQRRSDVLLPSFADYLLARGDRPTRPSS